MNLAKILRNSITYFSSRVKETDIEYIKSKLVGASNGARLHELKGYPDYISASFGHKYRIVGIFRKIPGQNHPAFFVMEVLPEHEYDKVLSTLDKISKEEINEHTRYISLGVEDSLEAVQEQTIKSKNLKSPTILSYKQEEYLELVEDKNNLVLINGAAGTGKTLIMNLYLQGCQVSTDIADDKPYAYITISERLAKEQEKIFKASVDDPSKFNVEFISVESLYRKIGVIREEQQVENFQVFSHWIEGKKKNHSQSRFKKEINLLLSNCSNRQIYEEFKQISAANLSEDSYTTVTNLNKSSISSIEDKKTIYKLYNLFSKEFVFLEKLSFPAEQQSFYKRCLFDEFQIIPLPVIRQLIKLSTQPVVMSGDFNQGPFYLRMDELNKVLQEQYQGTKLEKADLTETQRYSKAVNEASNQLLALARKIVGGSFEQHAIKDTTTPSCQISGNSKIIKIKDEHENANFIKWLSNPVNLAGTIFIFDTDDNNQRQSMLSGIIKDKTIVSKANCLSIDQVSGLEFKHVVYIPSKDNLTLLKEINDILGSTPLKDSHHRPKDKEFAQLQIPLLIFLRKLYVALTRAEVNAYLCSDIPLPSLESRLNYVSADSLKSADNGDKETVEYTWAQSICQIALCDVSQALHNFEINLLANYNFIESFKKAKIQLIKSIFESKSVSLEPEIVLKVARAENNTELNIIRKECLQKNSSESTSSSSYGSSRKTEQVLTIRQLHAQKENLQDRLESLKGKFLDEEEYKTIKYNIKKIVGYIKVKNSPEAQKNIEEVEGAILGVEMDISFSELVDYNLEKSVEALLKYSNTFYYTFGTELEFGITPLHMAINKGKQKIVNLLLEHDENIEVNTQGSIDGDYQDETPISCAAAKGADIIVKKLLELRADISIPTIRGETPLVRAAKGNHAKVVNLLLPKATFRDIIDSSAAAKGNIKETLDKAISSRGSSLHDALIAVTEDSDNLRYISKELRSDPQIISVVIRQEDYPFQCKASYDKYCYEHGNDDDFCEKISLIEDGGITGNKIVMLQAVEINGFALNYAADEIKNDFDVVLAAVKQDGWALKFASAEMQANCEIVRAAVHQNPQAKQWAKVTPHLTFMFPSTATWLHPLHDIGENNRNSSTGKNKMSLT